METKVQHTQGPWHVEKPQHPEHGGAAHKIWHESLGLLIASVYDERDAHLIAAAPELLEALETIAERLTDGRREMDSASMAENAEVARAAIAKARGEG